MARVATLHEDDETQVPAETPPPAEGATAQLTGGGATTATAAAPAPRQGRFQDIGRLLYANQGQGQGVAQQAIRTADAKATQAQTQLNAAQGAYHAQAVAPQQVVAQPQPAQVGANPLVRGARATTQVNMAPPDYEALQRQADSVYAGPQNFGQTQGVDQAALQRSFTDAQRAASMLSQPAGASALLGRTGGAGAFDDLLAQHEGGAQLRAAGHRLGGIRDMLNAAIKDTAPADAARATTEAGAASARGALADRDRGLQETLDRQTAATNEKLANDEAFRQWMNTGTYMPTSEGVNLDDPEAARAYFEANRGEIDAFVNGYNGAESYAAIRKYRADHGRPANAVG